MIDRAPNLDAARDAARATLADVESFNVADVATEPTPSTSSPAARPSAALLASRDKLVAMGAMSVHNLSLSAARRWGAHWEYKPEEASAVADAVLDVVALYIDELEGPWVNLGFVLVATALPRLMGAKLPPLVDQAPASAGEGAPQGGEVVAASEPVSASRAA